MIDPGLTSSAILAFANFSYVVGVVRAEKILILLELLRRVAKPRESLKHCLLVRGWYQRPVVVPMLKTGPVACLDVLGNGQAGVFSRCRLPRLQMRG